MAGVFRSMNDGIALFAAGPTAAAGPPETCTFHCECGDAACRECVDLDLGQYRAIRAAGRGRVLAPGHPVTEARRIRAQARELSEEARALRAQARQQVRRAGQARAGRREGEPPPQSPSDTGG